MNRLVTRTVMLLRARVAIMGLVGFLIGGLNVRLIPGSLAAADTDEDSVLKANKALEKALQKGDKADVARFLDAEFTWADAEGVIHTRLEILAELPQPIAISGGEAQTAERMYGQVAVIQVHSGQIHGGQAHAMRVWVKRSDGWKVLHVAEILQPEKPEAGGPGIETPCVNPCAMVPFKPKSAAERAVVKSWQAMETGAYHHRGAEWGAHTGEEFQVINSWSDKPFSKAERVADFDRLAKQGVQTNPIAPVMWARMWDFDGAIFMLAEHIRYGAKPDIASRVWVNREGRWLLVVSYHISIKDAPTLTFQTTAPN
jgi:hypothetical protein